MVSYRHRKSDDLFLGGRSMGWGNVGFSIFGTNIGPTFLIATCGAGYTTGMVTANFEWMAWVFLFLLGMVFVPFYLTTNISTMPEFVDRRFGPHCYTFMSIYALFGTVVLWIGGTLYAGGALLAQLLGWDVISCIWLLAVLATSFTVTGGLVAVMVTDSFQSVLMIIGAAALSLIAFSHIEKSRCPAARQGGKYSARIDLETLPPVGFRHALVCFCAGLSRFVSLVLVLGSDDRAAGIGSQGLEAESGRDAFLRLPEDPAAVHLSVSRASLRPCYCRASRMISRSFSKW